MEEELKKVENQKKKDEELINKFEKESQTQIQNLESELSKENK